MPSDSSSESRGVVVAILLACTVIGFIAGGQEADAGVALAWIWLGIGLSVTYLCYKIVVTLERLADAT